MPTHLPPMNPSWEISDTAHRTVSIARGLVEAATSDDISAVALHCCAQFGATLPVATETRFKIEQLARRNHTSHVLNFIKAQIGYRKDDSVEQLSRSDSGVRFLCFGATLCTLNQYEAADCLDNLLQATQRQNQLRPTVRQLQVMMASLKSKLALSDFAKSVAGFEILIRSRLARNEKRFGFDVALTPSKPSLQDLVLVLNQLGRLSEIDTIDGLDIKARPCYAPWVCAFAKWMLGVHPQIRNSDGVSLWTSRDSKVTVTVVPNRERIGARRRMLDSEDRNLDVIVKQRLRNIREIVMVDPIHQRAIPWQGLLPTEAWFRHAFQLLCCKFPEVEENKALRSAMGHVLCFIVKHLPDRLILCGDTDIVRARFGRRFNSLASFPHSLSLSPFPHAETRVAIACRLVSDQIQLLDNGVTGPDIFLNTNLASILHRGCADCHQDHHERSRSCRVSEFFRILAVIGAALLACSLFGLDPISYPMLTTELLSMGYSSHDTAVLEEPRVRPSGTSWLGLIAHGWQGLMYGKHDFLSCTPWTIFVYTAQMIGYKNLPRSTVIASKYGQVLFPTFLEAGTFTTDGFMSISAFPGKLLKDNMEFTALIERQSSGRNESDTESDSNADEDYHDIGFEEDTSQAGSLVVEDGNGQRSLVDLDQSIGIKPSGEAIEVANFQPAAENQDTMDYSKALSVPSNSVKLTAQSAVTANETKVATERKNQMSRTFVPFTNSRDVHSGVTEWTVSVVNDTLLGEPKRILFEIDADSNHSQSVALNKGTWWLLETFSGLFLTPSCPHSSNTDAGEVADQFDILKLSRVVRSNTRRRTLYNVGRSYGAQLLQLSFKDRPRLVTVIHDQGCVRCALKLSIECCASIIIS